MRYCRTGGAAATPSTRANVVHREGVMFASPVLAAGYSSGRRALTAARPAGKMTSRPPTSCRMATAQAFLDAIVDAPDDDAPRLVYADWLDDHGDADRAEFIRAQCEL